MSLGFNLVGGNEPVVGILDGCATGSGVQSSCFILGTGVRSASA